MPLDEYTGGFVSKKEGTFETSTDVCGAGHYLLDIFLIKFLFLT